MAKLTGYVFEVESDPDRDDDKIRENFEKIDGVTSIEYMPSHWGSPCVWTIMFEPPEKWKGLADTKRRLDRAVLARKAKKGEISNQFSEWVDSSQRRQRDEMMARGGPFSNVTFISSSKT